MTDLAERRRLLTELLGSLGEDAVIRPPFYCDYGYLTTVGDRAFANFGLVVLAVGSPARVVRALSPA